MNKMVLILLVLSWSVANSALIEKSGAQAGTQPGGLQEPVISVPMALKGKLLLEDDFKTPAEYTNEFQPLREGWRVRAWHAVWKRTDEGVQSEWTTGHNPVLAYEGSFQDVVIELDFRYHKETDPAKNSYIRINPTNLQLDPQAYSVSAWINANSTARPTGVVLEHEEWKTQGYRGVATQIATFEPDTWYTVRLEIIGDYAVVSCNGITVSGSYEKFALPKTLLPIGVGKGAHELRKLRIFEALPNPAWIKPAPNSQPYVPVTSLPPRDLLVTATFEKIKQMTPLFDGKTLNGWFQAPMAPITFAREDVIDLAGFAKRLSEKSDPVSSFISEQLDSAAQAGIAAVLSGNTDRSKTVSPILKSINHILSTGVPLYEKARFKGISLRGKTKELLKKKPEGLELARCNRLLLEDVYKKELYSSPDVSWVVKDSCMASTGAGRGVIYTDKDYANYRLVFQVRQVSGNHLPGVLLFCDRPPAGELGLDALGGIQFAVPNGSHWDYRPGINRSGDHFIRPLRIRYNVNEWAQVEILVNAKKGSARMAVAQPVGTRPIEILGFNDPTAGKAGPIALQMHNAQLFDEYKDIRIEIDPKEEDLLITLD